MSEEEVLSTGVGTESTVTGVGIDGINDLDWTCCCNWSFW